MGWFKKSAPAAEQRPKAAPPKTLSVSDYLRPESVYFFSQESSKEEIIAKLVGRIDFSDKALVLKSVLEREKMGGTLVEGAIAIPHARLSDLKDILLSIGICSEPVLSKQQPNLYFLFLSPKENTKTHLLFLSSLASLFQAENFSSQMLSCKSPEEALSKIREIEKKV